MKILVTGSSGFIGKELLRQLGGHEVLGLDSREPESMPEGMRHVTCDLLDPENLSRALAGFGPEVVIHLAAKTGLKKVPPGSPHFAVNTTGTANLIDAIRSCGGVRRVLYTSSKYVYRGSPPAPHRKYETNTSYGLSKAEMEELVWETDGAAPEWCILRPTTIWGPGVSPHYRKFFRMVRHGKYVHFGNGLSLKHLGYIENVAFQIRRLAEVPGETMHRRIFYVGDYEALRVGDWAEAFRAAFGAPPIRSAPLWLAHGAAVAGDFLVKCGWRKFPLTSFRFRNLTEDDLCEMEPTRQVCGEAPVALDEAVRRTARWFLEEGGHSCPP